MNETLYVLYLPVPYHPYKEALCRPLNKAELTVTFNMIYKGWRYFWDREKKPFIEVFTEK